MFLHSFFVKNEKTFRNTWQNSESVIQYKYLFGGGIFCALYLPQFEGGMESIAERKAGNQPKASVLQMKTESGGADNESESNFGVHWVQAA